MPPSRRIAIAGGTGGIGSHVVEGLLEIKETFSLHIIVLSRTSKPDIEYNGSQAPVIGVGDYNKRELIEQVLLQHEIDTVICTLCTDLPETFNLLQYNLLQAALNVPTFRRFAPSEWAMDSEKTTCVSWFVEGKTPIYRTLRSAVKHRPGFEFIKFCCGAFMNTLGEGNPKPDGYKALGHIKPFPYIVDLAKGTADVPGDGTRKLYITRAEDIGRFAARATQLDTWPEDGEMAGDVLTINELITVAEEVTGKKFEVKYNTEDQIIARINPEPKHPMENFDMEVYLSTVQGECEQGMVLNALLPEVKPMTTREYLQNWWGT